MEKVEIDPQILTRLAAVCLAAGDMMTGIAEAKEDSDVVTALDMLSKRITMIYRSPGDLTADILMAYLIIEKIPVEKIHVLRMSDPRKN